MKPRILQLTAIATVLAPHFLMAVPTEIARESFDGTPGAIGFTTSVPQFVETSINPQSDYFSIIPNNGTKISGSRTLSGGDGANIFAAEDCDTPRTLPATAGPQEVSLTTNAVNIAGKINTQLRLLMAAPGRSDGVTVTLNEYENFSNAPLFINKLRVEASIDGGAFQRVVQFSPSPIDVITTLSYDADGNNVGGDANPIPTNPATLDATLREGIYSIPTGNTVAIRITLETDATGELIAFDNIRIFGETNVTASPVLGGVPPENLVFTEGNAATAIAPAITVTDTDSANLSSATVTISQNYVNGEDVLAATPSGAILAGDIVFNPATGTLTITRSATKAVYQTVLRSVTYRDTNLTAPSTAVRRVTFSASDGANASNSPIRDINVVDAIVTQSLPFVESFETDGRGTRYSVDGGFSTPPSMFARVQPAAVAGIDGTFAWGVENVDDNANFAELVTFNLNAASLVNLTGELRVAANGGAVYDQGATADFLRVEVSADGGPFQNVLAFYADAAAQGNLRNDTTPGDASNVGDGTLLSSALQTFAFNLPAATTLTVRIRAFTNIVGENILFDRLAVQGTVYSPVITSNTDSGAGSLRQVLANAAANPGADTITFAPGFTGPITLTSGEIVINDTAPLTIDASSLSGGLTLSGGNVSRLFSVPAGKDLTLKNLTLTGGNGVGTTSSNFGGAILNSGSLKLVRCTLSGNAVSFGGGAITTLGAASSLMLENCTVAGNTANFGGGVWHQSGAASFIHCTVARNTGTSGSGGLVLENGSATFHNTLVAENTGTVDPDIGGAGTALTLNGSNLFGQPGSYLAALPAGLPNPGGDYVGTAAAPLNPRLIPLAGNGGPTQTLALLSGSPALDKGNTIPGLLTDQRGFTRSLDGDAIAGALPDIGAYEAQLAPFSAGFNFVGGGLGYSLPAADLAGVPAFAQQNWNNLATDNDGNPNGTAPNAASRNDATGTAISGLRLWWDAPSVASRAGSPVTPNEKLLWGYLNSDGTANSGTNLYAANNQPFFSISSLPAAATLGGYRVFVYADGAANDHVSEYWLASNRGANPANVSNETDLTTHRFRRDNSDSSTFTEVPATSTTYLGAGTPAGNVVRFDGMTEPGFTVRSAETAYGAFLRAELNAVQIVRNEIVLVTTAADELDPIGTLGTGISLREALRDAPETAGIVFDPAVFNGEPADTITFLASNPGFVLGKSLTIDASNITGGVTVNAAASNANQKAVFTVNASRSVSMLGLNITGGYNTAFVGGGGLLNNGATALTDCRLTGNTAIFGAAATSYSGSGPTRLTLRRCTISGNNATSNGGGLLNWATSANAADLRVEDSTVTGNSAPSISAGLYNYSAGGAATFTALRTTVSGNTSANGAGVYNLSAAATANCTMTLTHCTVSGNTANSAGGGCYNSQNSGTATLTLTCTIVAGNNASSAANGPDIFKSLGTITSLGGNLIGKTDGSGTSWLVSDITGTAAVPRAPLLAPLGNYGGPTQTMALLPGSPARNTATVSFATSDQRGFPILGIADIGAYEAGTFTDFEAWAWETLPASASPAQHAPTFDFDGDGRTLLLEYAGQYSGTVLEFGNPVGFTRNPAGTLATIVMPYRFSAPDLFYTIERSTTLAGAWTPILYVDSSTNGFGYYVPGVAYSSNDGSSITFTDTFIATQPRAFYRMQVTKQ